MQWKTQNLPQTKKQKVDTNDHTLTEKEQNYNEEAPGRERQREIGSRCNSLCACADVDMLGSVCCEVIADMRSSILINTSQIKMNDQHRNQNDLSH